MWHFVTENIKNSLLIYIKVHHVMRIKNCVDIDQLYVLNFDKKKEKTLFN